MTRNVNLGLVRLPATLSWVRNAVVVTSILLLQFPGMVRAQDSGPDNVQLLKDAEENVLSILTTDVTGRQINNLAPELYEGVTAALAGPDVEFPIGCTQIVDVMPLPGEIFKDKVLIMYEGSPAKTMYCRWSNGDYKCTSS